MDQPSLNALDLTPGPITVLAPEPETVFEPQWIEIRCHQCDHLLVKVIGYPIQEEAEDTVKFGVEAYCRYCKIRVYKTYVI